MSTYIVILPIAGSISVVVEDVNGEHEAIKKAKEVEWGSVEFVDGDPSLELEELDICDPIVEGNVCYAPQWESKAEECD